MIEQSRKKLVYYLYLKKIQDFSRIILDYFDISEPYSSNERLFLNNLLMNLIQNKCIVLNWKKTEFIKGFSN